MHELQFILEERKSTLDTLMTELIVSEISEKDDIYLNSNTVLNKGLCNAFLKRFDNLKGNFIYGIECENIDDVKILKKAFEDFHRSNKYAKSSDKRALSIYNNTESRMVYVGVKCKRLKNRIKQQLGYGPAKTRALHLSYWIPKNIKLKIEVYQVESENVEFLKFIERGFLDTLKPIFGMQKLI